ncbi:unnamed protein product [Rotaria sordida]|uniref:EGF-like domain-containing protein n=1 Tax=Rotaria sordida TaxID=392033 RepID=A0A814IK99_9BILA|nr:unnamed protein product [Rotaria sordida]
MVDFRSLVISNIFLILLFLLKKIDSSQYRSVRQIEANQCPNLNNNACLFVNCENGGECIEDPTTIDCFKCQCIPGYTGKICDTQIPIIPIGCNPGCQNGGVCIGNSCQCNPGFTGIICDTQIPIIPIGCNPGCQNGGVCIDNSCKCSPGFTGKICDTQIPIIPIGCNPGCQNGGVCIDNSCKCSPGFTGTYCEIKVNNPCDPNPCGIHGICFGINLSHGPIAYCNCENRWTGRYCDVNIDVNCPIGYCFSGGTCGMIGNVPYCTCPAMYTGERCEFFVGTLTTTTTVVPECPLNCAPGRCIFSGNAQKPYACLWNGVMRPTDGTTG